MLKRLRIRPRLVLLIAVQMLILIAAGLTAMLSLRAADHSTVQLNQHLIEQVSLHQMNEAVRTDVFAAISDAASGRIDWNQAQMDVLAARNLMTSLWDEYQTGKSTQEITESYDSLAKHYELLMLSFTSLDNIFLEQDRAKLTSYQDTQLKGVVTSFITELNDQIAQQQLQSDSIFQHSISSYWVYIFGSLAVIVLGLVATGTLGIFVYRCIEPVAMPVHAGQDNENINNAVMVLLDAVSKLSGRDLTIKIPVTEGVTGSVAEALNQFTSETAQVLIDVRRIAEHVAKAAVMVRTQSDIIIAVAANEQSEIDQTARVLEQTATTLNHLTALADACGQAAEGVVEATHTALQSTANTVDGIHTIHSTIYEAEKRIKRLGERSHDMNRATHLMSSFAERTHILALNIGMHAASAGEGGRGFALVVDEVQRLAENARDATHQIAAMVENLQSETSGTVLTINNAITQVAAGSQCAEQAGEHMLLTSNNTTHLVEAIRQIVQGTTDQIQLSTELPGRALTLQTSTRKSREQMQEQTRHTKRLVQYSKVLLSAVQVFTLPGEDEEISPHTAATPVPLKMRAS